jgi:hypothetical protein
VRHGLRPSTEIPDWRTANAELDGPENAPIGGSSAVLILRSMMPALIRLADSEGNGFCAFTE